MPDLARGCPEKRAPQARFSGVPVLADPATDAQPGTAATQPRLAMLSTVSSHGPGGLSALVRRLRRALSQDWEVAEAARFAFEGPGRVDYAARETERTFGSGHGGEVRILAPSRVAGAALPRVHHLVNRPRLAGLGIAAFSAAYRRTVARAVPARTDLVHAVGTGWELLGFAALREARERGIPFAVTPALHPGSWGDSPVDARLYRSADAVLSLSRHERERVIGLGVDPGKVHVVPLGPAVETTGDGARFRERHDLGTRPLVLFVARKQRYKGYHSLCAAVDEVLRAAPESCLVTIGKDAEPPYPAIRAGAHLDLGACGDQEKADALAACDVFCMPSEGEALGIAYLEAWAYGKPVVAGPAPAVRELVEDGVTGLCVENDAGAVGRALTRLLLDPALRDRLGSAGRALQQRQFTWEAAADAHDRVFRSLL